LYFKVFWLPLVGYAKLAIEQALKQANDEWFFP